MCALDGRRLLVCANEPHASTRSFVVEPASHHIEPVGPEGVSEGFPSPDRTHFAARDRDGWLLCSFTGKPEPRPIAGMTPTDEVVRWNRDGSALYCFSRSEVPSKLDRVDLASGRRETIIRLGDRDAAGLVSVLSVGLADDLKSVVYATSNYSSTLYTVSFAP